MKNICWISLMLLCFQQASAEKKMYIGLKGSPSVAWFQPKSNAISSVGTRIGFSYGLMTDFNFSENYAFGTGVEVNHHGGKTRSVGSTGNISELYKLQYLEIPLTLKMRTNEIGYFTYYGQFGLGASYLIGAEADTKITKDEIEVKENGTNVYKSLQPFRASLIVGLGAEYNISGSTKFVMGIAFDNGFTNPLKGRTYEEQADGSFEKGDKRKAVTNYISLTLGIIF